MNGMKPRDGESRVLARSILGFASDYETQKEIYNQKQLEKLQRTNTNFRKMSTRRNLLIAETDAC